MNHIMSDPRYTIALEYCGHDTPRWVVRFCGEWVGQAATRVKAREVATEYEYNREVTNVAGVKSV